MRAENKMVGLSNSWYKNENGEEETYIVLIEHEVEEGEEREVVVGAGEASQRTKDAPSEEHAVHVHLQAFQHLQILCHFV